MFEPKISIIVPVYNVEQYLKQCMDSLINQTLREIEIICVDDGSKDKSLDILKEYSAKDNRVKIISQKNQGLSGARNTGIQNSTGDYITFVDSDDWIDLSMCEVAYNAAKANKVDLILYSYVKEGLKSKPKKIFNSGNKIFEKEEVNKSLYKRCIGLYEEMLNQPENADTIVTAWGKIYKRNIIQANDITFVDTKKIGTEDALFNISALFYVNKAMYIDKAMYHYRKNNVSSLTQQYKENLFIQWQNLFKYIENILNERKSEQEYFNALNNRIALSILGLGLNELCSKDKPRIIIKRLHNILSNHRYRQAYKNLELKYFPIHWKVFYGFAKYNFAAGVYIMLKCINKMRGR